MNGLRQLLTDEANQVRPTPNLDDVYRRAEAGRRRAKVRNVALGAVAILAVVTVTFSAFNVADRGRVTTNSPSIEPTPETLGGMILTDVSTAESSKAFTLDRKDSFADQGPFSLVIRAQDGSFISRTAVVTFPIPASDPKATEKVPEPESQIANITVSRPEGLVGLRSIGLSAEETKTLAAAVRVVDGRPSIDSKVSPGFSVVASGSWRAPTVREARYGCADLREIDTQGLCYTGLTLAPGFEDALLQTGFQPGPLVGGHPSAVSIVGGGSGTLAWEPRPGVVAYIGFSAMADPSSPATMAALARLADRAQFLTPAQWTATGPQTVSQTNQWVGSIG